MTTIIFSKDRPMQLECLLRSCRQNAPQYIEDAYVIYTYSHADYFSAYKTVFGEYNVHPILQDNLKQNVINILQATRSRCIAFLCDDDIIFKKIQYIPKLQPKQTYSIRLGENIKQKSHFEYMFSVDGNIYNIEDIEDMVNMIEFNNPNEFEKKMQQFFLGWTMVYKEQYLVGIPHNRVSDESKCYTTNKYDEEELYKMFLDGNRIDYKNMLFRNITDVHAYIDYEF